MAPWLFATSTSVRCGRWLCADRNPPLFARAHRPPRPRLRRGQFADAANGDVAVEHLRSLGLQLEPALGQRRLASVHLPPQTRQHHVPRAIDDVDAGLTEAVELQRIPLALRLLRAAALDDAPRVSDNFGGPLPVGQLGVRITGRDRLALGVDDHPGETVEVSALVFLDLEFARLHPESIACAVRSDRVVAAAAVAPHLLTRRPPLLAPFELEAQVIVLVLRTRGEGSVDLAGDADRRSTVGLDHGEDRRRVAADPDRGEVLAAIVLRL